MRQLLSNLIILILICSCAKTPEEELDSAKREAKYYLSKGNCSKARNILNDVGEEEDDAEYISIYASTYGCEAGYSELDFIGSLGDLDSSSLIGSLASFDSSNPANFDHDEFNDLLAAINYILDSAGSVPSTTEREDKFGVVKGTDLSLQALYMIMTGIGKFFAYYGNANTLGVKAAGTLDTNVCIGFYDADADIDTYLSATPINGCNSGSDGHTDLKSPVAAATITTRLCQGIVLFNNMLEILSNITLSSNDSLGDLGAVADSVNDLFDAAETLEDTAAASGVGDGDAVATLRGMTSQTQCEAQSSLHHQMFYVIMLESNFAN